MSKQKGAPYNGAKDLQEKTELYELILPLLSTDRVHSLPRGLASMVPILKKGKFYFYTVPDLKYLLEKLRCEV